MVWQKGNGQTTFVAGSGVTIKVHSSLTLKSRGRDAMQTLTKVADNTWLLAGHLEAAP